MWNLLCLEWKNVQIGSNHYANYCKLGIVHMCNILPFSTLHWIIVNFSASMSVILCSCLS